MFAVIFNTLGEINTIWKLFEVPHTDYRYEFVWSYSLNLMRVRIYLLSQYFIILTDLPLLWPLHSPGVIYHIISLERIRVRFFCRYFLIGEYTVERLCSATKELLAGGAPYKAHHANTGSFCVGKYWSFNSLNSEIFTISCWPRQATHVNSIFYIFRKCFSW